MTGKKAIKKSERNTPIRKSIRVRRAGREPRAEDYSEETSCPD